MLRPVTSGAAPRDRYRFSGEFHYFRVPRQAWSARLRNVRDLGFEAVSIYVPWNWHQPTPDEPDLTGRTILERDLFGALDAIAAAGLQCIYRPGPFITAEWRDGGIPAWVWQQDPSCRALDAAGRPAMTGRPYPALTYPHPGYERPAVEWLTRSITEVRDWFASNGGPIVHLQLDDEPSYWQLLDDPLALDYNPFLVGSTDGQPARYTAWLLERYGSLDALATAHHTDWRAVSQVEPPRTAPSVRDELSRHVDWLDFKLGVIDEHVVVLERAARAAGFDGPISLLFPYLRPLQAAKFAAFARQRQLDLELTNECYVSLFSATHAPEQKVAHIIACHETYHMWRGRDLGPAFTMELQGSNSSFIPASVMEVLYAVTLSRAIRGFNLFMLVGGENPTGYENGTGRAYDLDAPIGLDGSVRPHADVVARQMRVIRAMEPELLAAEPIRDTWIGWYVPYESAALVGGRGVFDDAGAAMSGIFSTGDFGLSDANSLTALLTLSNVSWGALDLERADDRALGQARQLWVPGLSFMDRGTQERLVAWMDAGGHLVIGPTLPTVDLRTEPCVVLAARILDTPTPPDLPPFVADPPGWSQVRTLDGGALAVRGAVTRLVAPPDAQPIAWASDGSVIGFRRPVGRGSATLLGFALQYHPVGGPDQFAFAAAIVEADVGQRAAVATEPGVVALQMSGPDGGIVCLVEPVERPVETRIVHTTPGTTHRATMPVRLSGIHLAGRGARLLPVGLRLRPDLTLRHATAELVDRAVDASGAIRLGFATMPGDRFEVAFDGSATITGVEGGRVDPSLIAGPADTAMPLALDIGHAEVVFEALASEVSIRIGP